MVFNSEFMRRAYRENAGLTEAACLAWPAAEDPPQADTDSAAMASARFGYVIPDPAAPQGAQR